MLANDPPYAMRIKFPSGSTYESSDELANPNDVGRANPGADAVLIAPTVVGWLMSVMSRTTRPGVPRKETSARFRLDGVEAAKNAAVCAAGHESETRALEASVSRLDEAGDVESVSGPTRQRQQSRDGDCSKPPRCHAGANAPRCESLLPEYEKEPRVPSHDSSS